jgi:predicted ATPase
MKAAKAGIQIIIETHSDHIMNGALVAIVNEPEYLPLVKAYYFERDESLHTSKPCKLEILEDGRVANPPEGFFDQIDIDMRTIMGF